MERLYELKYHKLEKNHWWFLARRNIILNLIEKKPKNSRILEIGCSGGPLLESLEREGFCNAEGIDISKNAVGLCRKRGRKNVKLADGQDTGFSEDSFDIIIASDVLEHISGGREAISEWCRILKPEGILIIFVPAFQFLWSGHDEQNHHYRRYSKAQLVTLLEERGFKIKRSSYWNFLFFFLVAPIRFLQKPVLKKQKSRHDQLYVINSFLNEIFLNILKLENTILKKGVNLPVGLSVFCVAKKSKGPL